MKFKKLCLFFVLVPLPSLALEPVTEQDTDCLSYWQLRSVGLSREYGIASAKLSDQYNRQYQSSLQVLKSAHEPKVLVAKMYQSMGKLLEKIDNDYQRTAELDAEYIKGCPLDK